MKDGGKTKEQLINELAELRRRMAELEAAETERKRLEEQMRQQDRMAALGQLAGGIAHDFNNVLMTIILYAEILLDEPSLPPDLTPDIESILDEEQEAAHLVRQVLDFSRRSPIETRLVDLGAFVQESVDMLRRTLGKTPDPRLLDVGCGTGGTLAALSSFGRAEGLDTSERALAFCRERGSRGCRMWAR